MLQSPEDAIALEIPDDNHFTHNPGMIYHVSMPILLSFIFVLNSVSKVFYFILLK